MTKANINQIKVHRKKTGVIIFLDKNEGKNSRKLTVCK